MPTITLANSRAFAAASGVTILEAARQHGVSLEYSCRTGRCGVCRATVLSGMTTVKQVEQPGDRPLAPAEILTCCRTAESDIVVDIEDLGRLADIATQVLPCRIAAIDRCAPDIVHIALRLPPTASFAYLPGQYIDMIVGGDRRSYSIANAPRADGVLELYIRRYPGGTLSNYWFDRAEPHDLLRLEGPFGTFYLRDGDLGTTIFLATGTGIAPVKALLEEIARSPRGSAGCTQLFWGNREAESFCWTPEALGLDLAYTQVISGPGEARAGGRGWVQLAALSTNPDLTDTMVYACGSERMIAGAREAFVARGLPERRFLADAFVISN